MTPLPKASPAVVRVALVALVLSGLGVMILLASNGGGGGVDLFTDDLANEGIDPSPFIESDQQGRPPNIADPGQSIPEALPLVDDNGQIGQDGAVLSTEDATPRPDADTNATPLPLASNNTATGRTPQFSPTNEPTANQTGGNDAAGTQTPQQTTTQTTTRTGDTTGATNQANTNQTDATPNAPAVAPDGPWCQVEVRQTDGLIRWNDEGKTTVFRRNDTWFHTPADAAQAVRIPESVNTNDTYVMRLWGGGTTDITCSFVSTADVQTAVTEQTNNTPPAPAEPEVATVENLPTPIAVPGGPVQMGFSADLWADDRTNYWNDLEAVPGNGRLIAHEFKSFTKDIKTDVYRWHLESGRDLLLTWNGTDAETILNGSHDDWIRQHARELRSLPGTVMLRFWHEPDVSHKRAWIDNDPQQFIDSWLYVRQIFVEENARNIEWVWCPTAWNWDEQGARYYPGDANVDWICSDGYTGWDLDAPLTDIAEAYTAFQAWADQRPNKPILIAEFGAGQRGPGDRAEWVRGIRDWVADSPNIRAVVYFDVDRRPHGEIYDWRLRTEPDAWAAMMDVLSSAPFGR